MYCWKCGTRAIEGASTCAYCGAALRQPGEPAAPLTPALPEAPPPATSVVKPLASPPAERDLADVLGRMPEPRPAYAANWQPTYAGFWRRFWTGMVDYIVLFPFGLTVRILLGVGMFDSDWSRERALVLVFDLAAGWLYCALLESSRWQGTLGQQLLGLRVTDRHGRRVSFARATGRHVAQFLSFFTLGVGYLAMLVNRRRLTLHDWMSGCEIVRGGLEAPVAPMAVPHTVTPLGGGAGR